VEFLRRTFGHAPVPDIAITDALTAVTTQDIKAIHPLLLLYSIHFENHCKGTALLNVLSILVVAGLFNTARRSLWVLLSDEHDEKGQASRKRDIMFRQNARLVLEAVYEQ